MNASSSLRTLRTLAIASSLSAFALAEEATTLTEALTSGKTSANLRLRLEGADQDNGKGEASAATGRLRLGYETGSYKGVYAGVEFEATRAANDDYNAAGVYGNTNKAVIAEPPSTEINQAYLGYKLDGFSTKLGRQRIVRGNARFVGDVGWRQNQQTYDAASADFALTDSVAVSYAYVDEVQRIFGSESAGARNAFKGDIHLLDVTIKAPVTIGAYFYELDIENAAAASSTTFGGYLAGATPVGEDGKLAYRLELASQSDTGSNPKSYDAMYGAANATFTTGGQSLILGAELLGSDDGNAAFSTPLATLHKFNGWADVFLATPANGLVDYYVGATSKLPGGFIGKAFYHVFEADEGGESYGSEIDALLVKPINKNAKCVGKFAHYMEDGFGIDTTRFSVELNITL